MGLSIMAACLPTLRPLFREWSLQSWYEYVTIYVSTRTKFHSTRPKNISDLGPGKFRQIRRDPEDTLNPSQVGILQPKNARIANAIYPMMDLESQPDSHSGGITIGTQIEQSISVQSSRAS